MRVLCITSSYPTSMNTIAGNFVEAQVKCLRKRGIDVDVIAANMFSLKDLFKWLAFKTGHLNQENSDCFYSTSIINLWPFGRWFHKFWFQKVINKAVGNYVDQKGKPDIVHAHFLLWAGYSIAETSELKSVPLIVTEHSSVYFEEKLNALEVKCAARAISATKVLICLSEFLKTSMLNYFGDCQNKIQIIPNLVEEIFFEKYDPSCKQNYFVSIGRLVKPKGFDTLIEAFSKCQSAAPYKLVIVGDGEEMQNLNQLAHRLGVANRIEFKGTLSKDEILNLVRNAKIVISTSHFETFGLSVAEALATGTPVLVTNVGAPSNFVIPEAGEICKVADAGDTADKLSLMVSNYSKYNYQLIRDYALKSFGEDAIVTSIQKIYNNCVNIN